MRDKHGTCSLAHWHRVLARLGAGAAAADLQGSATDGTVRLMRRAVRAESARRRGSVGAGTRPDVRRGQDAFATHAGLPSPSVPRIAAHNPRHMLQPKSGSYPVAGSPAGGLNGAIVGAIFSLT